ncbi:hypothetical protein PG996_002872 [Apiospora saccharicola]|uniref:Peptidase S8/S53 domain-containing protein n=1 Tax=Apiospora saccharicola TaxID=335842 RepID=A0ABR1WKS4_9PEZI
MASGNPSKGRQLWDRVFKRKAIKSSPDVQQVHPSPLIDSPIVARGHSGSTLPPGSMPAAPAASLTPPAEEETIDRFDQFGLLPMQGSASSQSIQPDRKYQVDIVAIHGITGDAYDTWKAPSGELWLKDFLPEDLPGARVYSYGYDADVFFTKGTGNIETFARTLLENLKQELLDDDQVRPIIFICHSMGGLVIKQAIVTSILKAGNYGTIKDRTYGIVFLGTPHRGSNQTAFPSLLANIANIGTPVLSRFIGKNRTDLINALKHEASGLEKLSYQFADQLAIIKIASFIEVDITPPASERIVDGVTGIINCAGERVIDMQGCDHRSICRFAQRSNNYRLILGIIKEWANTATGQTNAAKQGQDRQNVNELVEECQAALTFQGIDWRKIELQNRALPGSCAWAFDHPAFQAWLDRPQGPLWIKGKPGSGKSTLMEILVEDYENSSKHPDIVSLHFFFVGFGYSKNTIRSSPQGMYRTLLLQLLEQAPESTSKFQGYCGQRIGSCRRKGIQFEWDENDSNIIRQHLNIALERLGKADRPVRVFVDAIDEVDPSQSEDVALYLYQLDRRLRGLGFDFRVCISSRHLPINTVSEKHKIVLEKENRVDIENWVRTQFLDRNIVLRKSLTDSRMLQELESKIISCSNGIFLWVWSKVPNVIKFLNNDPDNLKLVEKTLEEVPEELGKIYADILRNLIVPTDRYDAYCLLNWATHALDPMHVGLLVEEVQFSDAYTLPPAGTTEECLKINIRIGRFSGGLLEVLYDAENSVALQDRIAEFIHPSVRLYLQNHGLGLFERLLPLLPSRSSSRSSHRSTENSKYQGRYNSTETDSAIPSGPESSSSRTSNSLIAGASQVEEQSLQKMAENWRTKWETHVMPHLQDMTAQTTRVKIAVLDTGINLDTPDTWGFRGRIQEFGDFISPEGNPSSEPSDTDGHGTHTTSMVLKLAPSVDIYAARVSESYNRKPLLGSIVNAINWAIMHDVDIISISLGYLEAELDTTWTPSRALANRALSRAIRSASDSGIIIFASSNLAWPRTIDGYIPVWSADGYGQVSAHSLPPSTGHNNFAFMSDGPSTRISNRHILPSGSSFATPIAAAIAATILGFAEINSEKSPEDVRSLVQDKISRMRWLESVFQFMSSSRDAFDFVVPWKLFNESDSNEQTLGKIVSIIKSSATNERASRYSVSTLSLVDSTVQTVDEVEEDDRVLPSSSEHSLQITRDLTVEPEVLEQSI